MNYPAAVSKSLLHASAFCIHYKPHFAMKPRSLRFIFIYFLFMVSRLVAESPDDSGVSSSLCLLYKPLYVAVRTSKNGLQ